jgi:hypothetical protein
MLIDSDVLKAQLSAAFRIMEVTADEPDVLRPSVTINFGPTPPESWRLETPTVWEYDFTLTLRDTFKCPFVVSARDATQNGYIVVKMVSWLRTSLEPLDNYLPGPYNGAITITPHGVGFVASVQVNYHSEF